MSEETSGGPVGSFVSSNSIGPKKSIVGNSKPTNSSPNFFVRGFRSIFGYRKTSLSLFVFLTVIISVGLSYIDNSLEWSVSLPTEKFEIDLLESSWNDLQYIGEFKHPYGSEGNSFVHDFVEEKVKQLIEGIPYIEYDDDLNNTNSILFDTGYGVSYYESNNIIVRINGTRDDLPALLLSAHYDSVPSSFGITDDGVGIASLLGVLKSFTHGLQPARTLIFNFNNDEEFGLYGAQAFLNHPWSKQVKYFINLEGTGKGGKAILFRGTDYGITKEYNAVRYPYASSIFQQAFNSRVIHSETDYKIYFQNAGFRGIDIAFYKPRDIYHTGYDDIRHTSKKAVWHMLSSALDFVNSVSSQEIDADADYLEGERPKVQFASFATFLNYFFIISLPKLFVLNVSLLVISPVFCIILLTIIFGYKKNWRLGFVNSVKFPVSLVASYLIVQFFSAIIAQLFEFLPNSHPITIAVTFAAIFLFSNYLILNGINFIFKNYKIIQHDEKLIVILQISFVFWIINIITTAGIAQNKIGNDHTGEALVSALFIASSIASAFGLLGWCFKASKRELEFELMEANSSARPLLASQHDEYGAADSGHHPHPSDSSSLISVDSYTARKNLSLIQKTFSYDWLIQFLIFVPVPFLVIFNNGWLIISGLNKSIQESLNSEVLLYGVLEKIGIVLVLPLLPFVFKVNRIIVYIIIFGTLFNVISLFVASPFDIENPMKLRFIQSANLTESITDSFVSVKGRWGIGFEDILSDLPSVKDFKAKVGCIDLGDGMADCRYNSPLLPKLASDAKDFTDYLSIDILKNSSSNDLPYGLLTGEILIKTNGASTCKVNFDSTRSKDLPVKTIFIYKSDTLNNNTSVHTKAIPEGFSQDENGNFIYKDLGGIPSLDLNHLDSNKPFHVAFQWVPSLLDSDIDSILRASMKVDIKCLWSDLGEGNELVPAYKEINHYSPDYVSWANQDAGMFSVSTSIDI